MTFSAAFQSALIAQGAILPPEELKRTEFVARHVAVAMLLEAACACDEQASEPECPERATYCADAVRALMQQVQGEGK